jgi:hypothetical protein
MTGGGDRVDRLLDEAEELAHAAAAEAAVTYARAAVATGRETITFATRDQNVIVC